ncbi:MAG: glycosyltransferase [Planctomycetes bacterium]|nr:glycosyltransferase [Planctomycetota bacterium]
MHVVHVSAYFAPAFGYGGPPRSILGLCKHLQQAGVDVEVLTTTANGSHDLPASSHAADSYEGIRVRYLPRAFPRRFFAAAGLTSALREAFGSADLVHLHGLWNVPVWTAAREARRYGVPYVVSPRGMLESWALAQRAWRKRIAWRAFELRNLESAALLHATSAGERETLRRLFPSASIAMIPNGVEPPVDAAVDASECRRKAGIPDRAPIVLYLGRIHRVKRLDLLAQAFHVLHRRRPETHLVIAGPDENGNRSELQRHFAPLGQAVHWTGALDQREKWSWLAAANVLTMCSDSESFGLSVVEAMMAGLPVVATRTCPWQELESLGCGLWVEQEPLAIANAIDRIVSDPVGARQMGERGRIAAASRYCWGPIARAMEQQYQAVLARDGCTPAQVGIGPHPPCLDGE